MNCSIWDKNLFSTFAAEVESEDEYKGYLSEYLIFSKDGQEYLKDLKFSSFPFGDYNITVINSTNKHCLTLLEGHLQALLFFLLSDYPSPHPVCQLKDN